MKFLKKFYFSTILKANMELIFVLNLRFYLIFCEKVQIFYSLANTLPTRLIQVILFCECFGLFRVDIPVSNAGS